MVYVQTVLDRAIKMRTCIIIPTYNEVKSIGDIVKEICRMNSSVIVIDDGSRDNTTQIAMDSGAKVIRNLKNRGKGASLIKGFNYALNNNFDAVIAMDGDGQHLPKDVLKIIEIAKESKNLLFIGNRMQNSSRMPMIRRWTNHLMSWLISRLAGQDIPDTQCGLRLVKKELLQRLKLSTFRYETESEILIQASRLGYKIESVPITTIYSGENSQINPLFDTLRFLRFIFRVLTDLRRKRIDKGTRAL